MYKIHQQSEQKLRSFQPLVMDNQGERKIKGYVGRIFWTSGRLFGLGQPLQIFLFAHEDEDVALFDDIVKGGSHIEHLISGHPSLDHSRHLLPDANEVNIVRLLNLSLTPAKPLHMVRYGQLLTAKARSR